MHNEEEHPDIEEDEINLLDLLMVLVKHKLLIISIVFLSGAAAVGLTLRMTNIYRSEATIVARTQEKTTNPLSALGGLGGIVAEGIGFGGGGSLEKLEMVLKSRNLTNRVINKHKLMPVIFSDIWDEKNKKWGTDKPPTIQDSWKALQGSLTIKVDLTKCTLRVAFDHKDPAIAKNFVDYYIIELSDVLREEVLKDAAENMRFFRKQLEKTMDPLLQEKIYAMLAKEIEKETFARAQKHYSFLVLDPPIVPDLNKKIGPKRARTCILSVVVAFFLAVFLAFLKGYIHRLKTEDQERYQNLVQEMKFWGKKTEDRGQKTNGGRQ